MKRLFIIVEGQTEESFVNEVLTPHLRSMVSPALDIRATLITTNQSKNSKGGFVNYQHLRNDAKRLLKQQDVIVSMLVDFFRCPTSLPNYSQWSKLSSRVRQVEAAEQAIAKDINDYRFIPYIQLHEFEALLFSSAKAFQGYFDYNELLEVQRIIQQYPNPEDINTTPEGAPSKRLLSIKPSYDKVDDGNIIALELGIQQILAKCPRFKSWVDNLIARCK